MALGGAMSQLTTARRAPAASTRAVRLRAAKPAWSICLHAPQASVHLPWADWAL